MSRMHDEALEAAAAVERQGLEENERFTALGRHLAALSPGVTLTLARGSSDHAASYLAYLVMARLGCVVASLPLSLLTLGQAPLRTAGALAVAVSQSGQSPDVVEPMRALRASGACTVALVNDSSSPLAQAAEWPIGLHAGPERSVAATKSFIASLSAAARLVAHWQDSDALLAALTELPHDLARAAHTDWSAALPRLQGARQLMVVGRGLGLSVAQEAALKFKETSALQAEAFSGAEIRHGPMALVEPGYPLLVFALRGPTQPGLRALAADMRQRGAAVLLAAPSDVPERDLTLPTATLPELDPACAIQAFYGMAAQLAEARGLDPDQPRHLSKVTKTV